MKNIQTSILMAALLLFALPALAQQPAPATVHVCSTGDLTRGNSLLGERSQIYGDGTLVVLRAGDLLYTVRASSFAPSLEVGKDYAVKKIKGSEIWIIVPGKRGDRTVELLIRSIAEKP